MITGISENQIFYKNQTFRNHKIHFSNLQQYLVSIFQEQKIPFKYKQIILGLQ